MRLRSGLTARKKEEREAGEEQSAGEDGERGGSHERRHRTSERRPGASKHSIHRNSTTSTT